VQDLLAERPAGSVVFQKQGVFVAQLGLEVQLFRLLKGEFLRVFFSDLQEKIFPLHGIETDNHFFVDGVELGAEPFVEGSEVSDSGVEPIFAHFEVVPEHVVFELSQRVPARRKGVTAVFGHHDPERFEARNRNGTVFVRFFVYWFLLFFLVISVREKFYSSVGLPVFLKDEKGSPFLEFNIRFFIFLGEFHFVVSRDFQRMLVKSSFLCFREFGRF